MKTSKIDAIYSYDFHSESARKLATLLRVPMIRHNNSTFKGIRKTVLNWGSRDLPIQVRRANVLNQERAVHYAINKVLAFTEMLSHNVPSVEWTTNRTMAIEWLADGHRVFARTRLSGKDGEGLVECFINDQIPEAKLYTKFVRAVKEFRLNILGTNVVSCQRKVRLDDHTGIFNDDIKTSFNGYGFKWVTQNVPDQVKTASIAAIQALQLDFGGVDVIWDGTRAWVLEVNTAPELTPKSANALAEALIREYPIDNE